MVMHERSKARQCLIDFSRMWMTLGIDKACFSGFKPIQARWMGLETSGNVSCASIVRNISHIFFYFNTSANQKQLVFSFAVILFKRKGINYFFSSEQTHISYMRMQHTITSPYSLDKYFFFKRFLLTVSVKCIQQGFTVNTQATYTLYYHLQVLLSIIFGEEPSCWNRNKSAL